MISPLWEKTRSTGADVAGQHRILQELNLRNNGPEKQGAL